MEPSGWLAGLAGRRFLVLIIKVTLSELSEASAPSIKLNRQLGTTFRGILPRESRFWNVLSDESKNVIPKAKGR